MVRLLFTLCLALSYGCSSNEMPGNAPDTSTDPDTSQTIPPAVEPGDHLFAVPLSPDTAAWDDMAFLAAIPASSIRNGGRPLVIAPQDFTNLNVATVDFLRRLKPENAYVLSTDGPTSLPHVTSVKAVNSTSASDYSKILALEHWAQSAYLVVTDENDYRASVFAASLAGLLEAPLIYTGPSGELDQTLLDTLKPYSVLWISSRGRSSPFILDTVTQLPTIDAALRWVRASSLEVEYIALTNTNDRLSGKNQKLSLTAPMYATRRKGLVLPIALDMPAEPLEPDAPSPILNQLNQWYETMGNPPTHLALVGAFDALPQTRLNSIFDYPIEEHPVSDLPYAELDSDPFSDIALGRIISDTAAEASLLASRTSTYELLLDGTWERQFIETGLWGFVELSPLLLNTGFDPPKYPTESVIRATESFEVAAILHKDHSNCTILGNAFDTDVEALYAPAVITSGGCSVGGMDLVPSDRRTIVEHMLGRGAVAFLGATRAAISENTFIDVGFWNRVLAGETLGEAFQGGTNDMLVHWLDENRSAGVRYAVDTEILYGDPGLRIYVPAAPIMKPAMAEVDGDSVTVRGPEEWSVVPFRPEMMEEWNYEGDFYVYVGPGAAPRAYWSGSHDIEDLYYGVSIKVDTEVSSITQVSAPDYPLGWMGNFYTDNHNDGTATIRWRVRLIDYDFGTGMLKSEQDRFTYILNR